MNKATVISNIKEIASKTLITGRFSDHTYPRDSQISGIIVI
jgi:hypothetical protein